MDHIKDWLSQIESALARLDRQRLLAALQPGVPVARSRGLLESNSLSSSSELESLYSWRDGTDTDGSATLGDLHLFPGFYFLSIEHALLKYQSFSADARWVPGWLPVFANGGGDFYVVDVNTAARGSVRHFRIEESEHPVEFLGLEAMLVTLATAFERQVFYLDRGYLEVDDEQFASLAAELNPQVPWWVA